MEKGQQLRRENIALQQGINQFQLNSTLHVTEIIRKDDKIRRLKYQNQNLHSNIYELMSTKQGQDAETQTDDFEKEKNTGVSAHLQFNNINNKPYDSSGIEVYLDQRKPYNQANNYYNCNNQLQKK